MTLVRRLPFILEIHLDLAAMFIRVLWSWGQLLTRNAHEVTL